MNKLHFMILILLISAPVFGMELRSRDDSGKANSAQKIGWGKTKKEKAVIVHATRQKRAREQPKLNPDDLDPYSRGNLDHFENITTWARREATIQPNYGQREANAWIKALKEKQQKVDPVIEKKIRDLAQRRKIMIQTYSTDEETWKNIAQEELCQFALENLIAVSAKKSSKKNKIKK